MEQTDGPISSSQPREDKAVAALSLLAAALARNEDTEDFLAEALPGITVALDLEAVAVLLLDEAAEELRLAARYGSSLEGSNIPPGSRFPVGEGPLAEVVRTRRAIVLPLDSAAPYSSEAQRGTAVAAPLLVADRMLGILCLSFRDGISLRDWISLESGRKDEALLRGIADQIAVALDHARLRREASRDQAEMRAVIQSLGAGLFAVSLSGAIQQMNPAAAALIGRSPEDLIGQPCREMFPIVDEAGRRICDWACGLARGERGPVATVLRGFLPAGDGQQRTVNWSCSALRDGEGQLLGWLDVVQDVSDLRAVEEMQTAFISAVSHEFLTPIAIIKGHAESLRDPQTLDRAELLDQALTTIDEEAERLHRLVINLLDVARIQGGGFRLELAPLALPSLVERIVQRFRGRSRRHRFEVSFPPTIPLVLGDRERVESIVYNLLDNAIKYSPRGGTIHVRGEIEGSDVVISVSDEGIGIPWTEQERIFERFHRVRSGGRPAAEGSGLGLFIVKTIVEAHGGRVWVESRPGRGATFRFSLPREAPAELPTIVRFGGTAAPSGE